MKRVFVCREGELVPGKPVIVDLENEEQAVIFRTGTGIFAIENRCPHAGALLHEGLVDKETLTCIWHGWKFDLKTGQCLDAYWAKLKIYSIVRKGGELFLIGPGIDEEAGD